MILFLLLAGGSLFAQTEICDNGIDDDGNGLIDCYDPACSGVGECEGFFFGQPEADCNYSPPELEEIELNLVFKTDETQFPIDQRAGVFIGDMNGDGIADLVSRDNNPARIQIFSGDDGRILQSIVTPTTHPFGQTAIADVDANGMGDVFQVEYTGVLARYEFGNPNAVWRTGTNVGDDAVVSTPQIADINQDGVPEVYVGDRIFNAITGERYVDGNAGVNVGAYATGSNADRFPIYYDLYQPGDPKPGGGVFGAEAAGMEYIAGNQVWTVDFDPAGGMDNGTFALAAEYNGPANLRDGLTSIADINGDGRMDIAVMDAGDVYAWDPYTNEIIGQSYQVPNTTSGGRINIGDFDGDGDVELGFAGRNIYVVRNYIDNDGDANPNNGTWVTLWDKTGLDDGSQRTGSTLFDFDGNGTVEVVYSEEENLFIYDGATGMELFRTISRSGTRTEYPIVADVNGDGTAEIIVTAQEQNGPRFSGTGWISVYESANQPWVPARPVWNQHGYNVTNINDDLTVPQFQQDNLNPALGQRYNNFLVQTAVGGGSEGEIRYPAPDAIIDAAMGPDGLPLIDFSDCPNTITITLRVENGGSAVLPGSTPISFYDGDPRTNSPNLITTTTLPVAVQPGDVVNQNVTIDVSSVPAGSAIFLSVNDPGFVPADLPFSEDDFPLTGVAECDYTNNVAMVGNVRCGEICNNGIDDDGDGITDEPNLVQFEDTGCPGDVLQAIQADVTGGTWSVVGGSAIGTTVDANGVVTLGDNFTGAPVTETIRYDDGICVADVMVTTVDDVDPTVTCPGDATVEVDAGCTTTLADYTTSAQATDNCTAAGMITITQMPTVGSALNLGANTVTVTAADQNANTATCTFTITAVDRIAPDITCPTDVDVVVDANCEYQIPDLTAGVSTTDNCSADVDISLAQTPVQGEVRSNDGTNVLVTLTATDEAGNVSNCTYTLTLADETPPTITCPGFQDRTLNITDCTLTLDDFRGQVQRQDNCSSYGQISFVQSPVPGTVISTPGQTTITMTGTDAAGNSSMCTFTYEAFDRDPPQLTCPPSRPIDINPATCDFTVPDITTEADIFDNCGAANLASVTQSPAAGTTFTGFFQNVTVTAVDASGNSNICVTSFTVGPPPPPTITCPADQDLVADANCLAVLPDYTGLATTDGCGTIMVSQQPGPGTNLSNTTTVTLTATNSVGDAVNCTFAVNVLDQMPPTVTCPATQTIAVDGTCEVPLPDYTGQASTSDNCDPRKGPVTLTQSPAANTMYDINDSPVTVTLTATDDSGNTGTCFFQVELMDNQPPQISCPVSPQTDALDASCNASIPDFRTETMVSSTCSMSGFTLTQVPAPGTVVNGEQIVPITITADDGQGNTVSCTFDYETEDVTDPTITCPAPQTESLDGDCEFTLPDYTGMATVADNCSSLAPAAAPNLTVTQSPPAGTVVSGDGTVTSIMLTVSDAAGNSASCSFDLTTEDDTPPVPTCPPTQNEVLTQNCNFAIGDYTALVTATDNCTLTGGFTVTQSPAPNDVTLVGPSSMTLTMTVTDEAGNQANCSFDVVVTDATPPVISCPPNPVIALDGDCMATVPDFTGDATLTDNCSALSTVTVVQDVLPGTVISGDGTTQDIILTATDGAGLTANCTVTITLDDVTPPLVTCPAAQDLNLDATGCQVALSDFSGQLLLDDNCTENTSLTIQQMPAAGTIVMGAETVETVTFDVNDGNGNTASCNFNVTLKDVTDPVVTCPPPATLTLDANCSVSLPDYRGLASATDDCAMSNDFTYVQSPAAGTNLTFDGANAMVTITAEDNFGNTSSCTFTVTAEDTTPPMISCPADRDEAVSGNCDFELPDYTGEAATMDNCSEAAGITVVQSPAVGTIIPEAQLNLPQTITLTATDAAGNSASCTFEITPVDEEDPTIVCPVAQTVLLDAANCDATLGDYTSMGTPLDNCTDASAITVTQDIAAGTVYNGLTPPNITVTLTAEDAFGNTADCSFTVLITDEIDPTVDCSAANQTVALDENCNGELPDLIPDLVTDDNCSANALTFLQNPPLGSAYGGDGTVVSVTFTVTDASGNAVTCMATVTFEDQSPPNPVDCPADQELNVDDICDVPLPDYTGSATVLDNCRAEEDIIITQSPAPETMVNIVDNPTVTVTLTADDGNGNTATCTFVVTLVDENALDLTCPGGQIIIASSDDCDGVLPEYTGDVLAVNQCMVPAFGATLTQMPAAGLLLTRADLDIPQTVTITATDLNGNNSQCVFLVTLVDTLPPVMSCPVPQTDTVGAACEYVFEDLRSLATIMDNCASPADLVVTQSPSIGSVLTGPDAQQTVTITATDPSGNRSQCSFELTIADEKVPVVACPEPDTILVNGNCEITIGDYTSEALATDNCTAIEDMIIEQVAPPGTVIAGHLTTETVTITATDASGNTANCVFTVTAKDETPPMINCPGDQVVRPDADCNALLPDYRKNAVVTDNCTNTFGVGGISMTQRPAPGTVLSGDGDARQITLIADDGNGNVDSCKFIVRLEDNTPPTIDCPADKTIDLDENCEYDLEDLTVQADVLDNCTAPAVITVAQNIGVGQTFGGDGTEIAVTLTADDGNGNTAQCVTRITLEDTTDPTIVCPADQEIFVDAGCDAVVPDYRNATVDDNCTVAAAIVVTQVPAPGTVLSGHNTVEEITLTANDGSGNTISCTFDLTLLDNTPPTIDCPPNQEIFVDGSCTEVLPSYIALATALDNCSSAPAVAQNSPAGTSLTTLGARIITLTADDGNGNTTDCVFMVDVKDNTPPELTCPTVSVIPADVNCVVTIADYRDSIMVSDNCAASPPLGVGGQGALTLVQSPVAGAMIDGINATQSVSIIATDPSGNSTQCVITVELADTTRPTIVCPNDTTLAVDAACDALIPDYTTLPVVMDNCENSGNVTVTQSPVAGTMVGDEASLITITLTATDASGNAISCDFDVQLIDSIPPSVTCPADVTETVDANCEVSLADYRPQASATDNCSATAEITFEQRPAPGTTFSEDGTVIPVTLIAVDQSGNRDSCVFDVTLDDAVDPVILACPSDTTVFVDAACAYDIPDFWAETTATATDNCTTTGTTATTATGNQIVYTQMPAVATELTGGITTQLITLTADDGNGNNVSCTFTLSLSDTISPVITVCPPAVTVNPDADCNVALADYTPLAIATDNCVADGSVTFTQSPVAGTIVSAQGTMTEVTITATDANGNTSDCSFEVTIQDNIPPSIECPDNQAELVDASCMISLPDYTNLATVADNCTSTANIDITQTAIAGTTFTGVQTQTITLTADDGNGNTTDCTFEVSIEDEIDPVLTCPAISIIPADANCDVDIVDYRDSVSVTDNCDASPPLGAGGAITLTQDVVVGTTINGLGSSLEVTITAEDQSGRTDQCVISVQLIDTIRPMLVCARDTMLGVDAACAAVLPDYRSVASATDNCNDPSEITFTQSPAAGATLNAEGTTQTVTITATDATGNSISCDFVVTLIDTIDPVVMCPVDDVISVDGGCEIMLPDYRPNAQSTDNCSDPSVISLVQDPIPGTPLSGDGTTQTVTITATDESGNSSICTLLVTLEDSTDPMISCPADQELTADDDCVVPIPDYTTDAVSSSACDQSNITIVQSPAPGTLISGHNTSRTITLTATDASGNSVSCDFEVTLVDRTAPEIMDCPADQTSDVNADCEFTLPDYWATTPVTALDNCRATGTPNTATGGDKILYTQDPAPGTVLSSGMATQTITLTADDGYGNTVSCAFELTLNDAIPPVITVCPNDTIANPDANCEFVLEDYTSRAEATDNCEQDGAITFTQSPVAGTTISGDETVQEITITATDANGNTVSCSFDLMLADTTSPTITCPADQVELVDATCSTDIEDYTALAITDDNCDAANVTVSQLPAPGTTFTGVQTQTITLTADDGNGNTTPCTFTLSIEDEIDPELTCPAQSIIPADASCEVDIVSYLDSVSVTDNCDVGAMITLEQDITVGTTIDGLGATLDVTITATDQSGNTDQCVITVVLLDTIRPVLTCVNDTILGADAGCNAVLPDYRDVASATDNCNDDSGLTFTQTPAAGLAYSDETTSIDVTIRATDATGNFTECTFNVQLVDTIAPTVICPQDQIVEVDANCEITLDDYRDQATPADNCSSPPLGAGGQEITLTQRPAPGTTFSGEATMIPVTIIAEDQSGNRDSCLFMVELNDVTPPEITVCQNDTTGVLTDVCDYTLPDYWNIGPAAAQDNCRPTGTASTSATGDQITYTQSPAPGTVLTESFTVTTITLTADDGNGNTVSCDFELTLIDTISPTITCPMDTIANPNAGCDFTLEDYTGRAIIADNCTDATDLVVSQSPPAGTVINGQAFSQDITLTVMDPSGNTTSCTFNLMLQDTISPTIDCPANKVETLTASCEFTVPDYSTEAVTDDNCTSPPLGAGGQTITVTQSPIAGTIITDQNEGDTFIVTLTADDGNGNTTSCNFLVTLDDVIDPVITCPADSTIFVDASCEAPLPDLVAVTTATDNCATAVGGNGITIAQSPLSAVVYNGDDTQVQVTLTADDSNGNSSQCIVTVTLQDTISPMIDCPANEVLVTDGNCDVMLPDYRPQAMISDNCTVSGNITVSQDIAPGTVFSGEGTSQVITLTADDGNGNTTSCTLEISVDDNVPPTIVCPATQTQFTDGDCIVAIDDYTSLAVTDDNCTSPPLGAGGQAITVTQSPAPGTVFTGVQNVVVTLTADDGNGNTTTCDFAFFVRDNTEPVVVCPPTQQETADADCVATIGDYTGLATATDNCSTLGDANGNGITLTQNPPAGTTIIGFDQEITVTITATDSSGNFSSCDFQVELIDEIDPTVVCPPAQTLFADANCNTALEDYRALAVGDDNCDTPFLTYVQMPAAGLPLSGDETMQQVTIEVTDRSGNSAECMFTVTVQDTISPSIICPGKDTLAVDGPCIVELPDYTDQATVADNCEDANITVTQMPLAGTEYSIDGTIIDVTLTADDGNGNTTSCVFQVELVDQAEPTILCPGRQVLQTDGDCEATIPDYTGLAAVSTECDLGVTTLTQDPAPGTLTISGDSTIQLVTITATDDAQPPNVVSCTFEVILVDDTDPEITVCPPSETVYLDASCEAALPDFRPNLTAMDNCEAFADMRVAQTPVPGTVFSNDDTEIVVTYTLDDTNGNTVSCTSTVTLQDTISPMITCPTDQVIFTDANCEAALPDYTDAAVSDNCTTEAALVTTQIPAPGDILSGFNDSRLVTLTVDDGNGQTTSCSFTVTLDDDEVPEITCPNAQDIDFGTDCEFILPDYRSLALLDDNCAANLLTVVQSPSPDSILNDLNTSIEVSLTVTDASDNSARCVFTVTTVSDNPPPARNTVTLAVVNRPTGTGTVNLDDAFDNMAISNLSNLDLDLMLNPGFDPFLVTYYLTMEDADAEVRAIPAENYDPAVSGEVVIARIEDPATGCFVLSQILLSPREPGISDAVDVVQCNRPGTSVKIDGRPVPGGQGTTIVRHTWRIVSPGTTRIKDANLMQTDQQVLMINTSGLQSGTITLEYQFFEDYGDGALVPSVPKQIALELQNVGGGKFFWDGN